MGRPRRAFIEGGVYHVYNRVARDEPVFGEEGEAARLVKTLREVKEQDGFSVLAWCVMSNHYHLAVRMGNAPLSRTMQAIQQRVSRSFNGRHKVYGPFWQGRYKMKAVEDPRYLRQLIVYIHNNPTAAGEGGDYRWSGHHEIVKRTRRGLLDAEEMLLVFGETRRAARRTYLQSMEEVGEAEWASSSPGQLPWWRLGRPRKGSEDMLHLDLERPRVDALGRSTAVERPPLELPALLEVCGAAVGLSTEQLKAKTSAEEVVLVRQEIVLVAVERYGAKVGELGGELGRSRETIGRWLAQARRRRAEDHHFTGALNELDRKVASLGWAKVT